MRCKMFCVTITFLLLTVGCSSVEKIVYRPDINQGNYLTDSDINKIHKGMTQQQVAYALGTPMLQDPFGADTWFYLFRQQLGHQDVTQKTLILTFDKAGVLTGIENNNGIPGA